MSAPQSVSWRRTTGLLVAGTLAVAGLSGLWVRAAVADPVLPPLTPSELLAEVAGAEVDGLTATFALRSDLGLPALPTQSLPNGDDLASALALLTGDHTIRVWTSGTDLAKVALVDGASETAMIRNGDELWTWSSETQEAGHATVEKGSGTAGSATPRSPSEAIGEFLDALDPTTEVTTSGTGRVAGRPVYQLVLTPRDDASLVGQVRVSVDAETFVPLGARVVADDGSDAVTLAASSVSLAAPDESVFDFTPPPGAEVTEITAAEMTPGGPDAGKDDSGRAAPTISGTGWTTVAVTTLEAEPQESAAIVWESLPEVSGDWGSGRLLQTTLLSAVLTDDGRVAVGAVTPDTIYAALAKR